MYSVRSMPSLSKTPYTHIGVLWVFFPSMVLRKEKVKKGYLYTFLYTYIYTYIGVLWVFFPSMVLRKEKVKKGYLYTFLYTYI